MSQDSSTLLDNEEIHVDYSLSKSDADDTGTYKLYTRRFYIAFIFCVFALCQGAIWNTWGPVSDTAAKLYGWDNLTLAMLPNWGPIMFIIAFIPMVKIILHFGLRVSIVHCAFLLFIGAGIRCIPCNNLWMTILAHICGSFCGYCGTLGMIAPTAITAAWFPPGERTTATAFMTLSNNNVATGFSFLAAKLLVRDYNLTDNFNSTTDLSMMRQDMERFMLTEFGIVAVLFLAVLIYYPKQPPTPPSSSASMDRVPFKEGTAEVSGLRNFWLILLTYAISSGAMVAFISVLDEELKAYDISQEESDWLGFYSSLVGIPGGLIFSWLADCRKKWMKLLLVLAVFGAGIAYVWFTLICFNILPSNVVCLYASILLGGFFGNGSIPLFYELGCELSYPVSEVVVTGLMTASNNICCGLILVAVMFKQLGTVWVNPLVSVSFLICVPMLICLREEYRRMDVDNVDSSLVNEDCENIEDLPRHSITSPGINTK